MTEEYTTDCISSDGVTVALIDGLIATCRVLRQRDLTAPAVVAALRDVSQCRDVHAICGIGRLYLFERRDELLAITPRTPQVRLAIEEVEEEIQNLPTARNASDQRAMDLIHRAAALIKEKGLATPSS